VSGNEGELNGERLGPWSLVYERYDPQKEGQREALCTLGNGRFATRGAASDVSGASDSHYPGTYAAGVYNRLTSEIDGKVIEHEELVNLPNWLPVSWSVDGEPLGSATKLEFRQELDFARGLLLREVRLQDGKGRVTRVRERRLVHMHDTHLAALHITFEPENWSGLVCVESWIDGRVQNTNADEYRGLDRQHLDAIEPHSHGDEVCSLTARTRQSRIEVVIATRTRCDARQSTEPCTDRDRIGLRYELRCSAKRGVSVEKVLALYTSRDSTCSEPREQALRALSEAPSFDALLESHTQAWQRAWSRFVLDLGDLRRTTSALRLHAFHLLQTISPASVELDVGAPARGLSGENYHGHIFWDELFVLPIFHLRWCSLARALLLYRYRRLAEARRVARQLGCRGAAFPWRSASDGREVTERFRKNPLSKRWIDDHSHRQRHINASIAYNVWQYFQVTDDQEFMISYGAELLLSVASFWSSYAEFDEQDGRYHMRGVVGPDEFHDAYPDREQPGIDDNAYTNIMAVWCLLRASEVIEMLPASTREALLTALAIDERELNRWQDITKRMAVCFLEDGVIEQFRGFDQLTPFPFEAYRARYGDIHRLDNILECEGDTTNRYQVCKQADVLMLFYLLSVDEVSAMLRGLGYAFDDAALARNVRHYMARTSNGSTLSRVVHAWVLTRLDRELSWSVLHEALGSDLADIQGGSTREGVHIGAMAGTIDVFQRAYMGLELRDGELILDPYLPPELKELSVRIRYRGQDCDLRVDGRQIRITTHAHGRGFRLRIGHVSRLVEPGSAYVFPCGGRTAHEKSLRERPYA
jgi:alpha,alpha-trehalase